MLSSSAPSSLMSRPLTRRVIISANYDNCFSALFSVDYLHFRRRLNEYLNEITQNAAVKLYVSSARQDNQTDLYNANHYKNGLCFPNYEVLCRERGWRFMKLLYPDVLFKWAAGTTMNAQKGERGFNGYRRSLEDPTKVGIIQAHLDEAARSHPGERIDFYCFDDTPAILDQLENKLTVPAGFKVHIVRSDAVNNIIQTFALMSPSPQEIKVQRTTHVEVALTVVSMNKDAQSIQKLASKKEEFKDDASTHSITLAHNSSSPGRNARGQIRTTLPIPSDETTHILSDREFPSPMWGL